MVFKHIGFKVICKKSKKFFKKFKKNKEKIDCIREQEKYFLTKKLWLMSSKFLSNGCMFLPIRRNQKNEHIRNVFGIMRFCICINAVFWNSDSGISSWYGRLVQWRSFIEYKPWQLQTKEEVPLRFVRLVWTL